MRLVQKLLRIPLLRGPSPWHVLASATITTPPLHDSDFSFFLKIFIFHAGSASTMTRFELWHLSAFLFSCLALLHLYVSPFTKVEESFNIQAAHDVLTYGVPTQNVELRFKAQFDHMEFPGAVPRTFIGALMLAGIAGPVLWLRDGLNQQMVVRGILGAFNALSLITYAVGVKKTFGRNVAAWFVLFQASQFHIFYYASRTLPNMFAFGISTLIPSPPSLSGV